MARLFNIIISFLLVGVCITNQGNVGQPYSQKISSVFFIAEKPKSIRLPRFGHIIGNDQKVTILW